jgi:putative hydrolase of the HAD superfamily
VSHYRVVLFDWVGTLVHYQPGRWRLRRAHENVGRPIDGVAFEAMVSALDAAYGDLDVREAMATEDCSPELHRVANMLWFERAGLDRELAEGLYAMDFDPVTHPVYPDARGVLAQLHAGGTRIAVVSNFHRDIRPAMIDHGFGEFVDAVVISSEHGFQKPDPRMFTTALELLGADTDDALMVGDWAPSDGAAAALGIDTLILPMPGDAAVADRGLDAVLRLVG